MECRLFGAEIEYNDVPMKDVAWAIAAQLRDYVEVTAHGHKHWNKTYGYWLVKPDSSCGIEVCSPLLKGSKGIRQLCSVIDVLKNLPCDGRCSFHLHLSTADCSRQQINNILGWWVKCEPVIYDSFPDSRKNSKYCQFIGFCDFMEGNTLDLIDLLGQNKYKSINTYHHLKGDRSSLEVRPAENEFCKNSYFVENWVTFILLFFEKAKDNTPENLYWLDIPEVLQFLDLPLGVRKWFLDRIARNQDSTCWFFKDRKMLHKVNLVNLI